ncbi:MAG: hypothetical protein LCH85_07710 [Chloroflexi bacterium]|nr:hypothetical protein [Chloroflexota bacterium]
MFDSWRSLGFHLAAGFYNSVLCVIIGGILGFLTPPPWSFALLGIAWLGISAYWAGYGDGRISNGFAGMIIIWHVVILMFAGMGWRYMRYTAGKETINNVTAAEIPYYPNAAIFYLNDAVVQTNYATVHKVASKDRKSSRITYSYYSLAPLTNSDWQYGDPVPAWAACNADYNIACYDWDEPITNGALPEELYLDKYTVAKLTNLATYDYAELNNAPMLEVGAGSNSFNTAKRWQWLFVWVIMVLVWAVPIVLIGCVRFTWRWLRNSIRSL